MGDPVVNAAPGLDRENLVACSNAYTLVLPDYRPSTGLGHFDVVYFRPAAQLIITVKCSFRFEQGHHDTWGEEPVDPKRPSLKRAVRLTSKPIPWPSDEEKVAWKKGYLAQVSSFWSDKHAFTCKAPGWDVRRCPVLVRFVEFQPQGTGDGPREQSHFEVRVHYIPTDEMANYCGTDMGSNSCVKADRVVLAALDLQGWGARHEAGHMLGLDDEYWEKQSVPGPPAAHSDLVRAEFGHEVIRGKAPPDGIMASKDLTFKRILPEHGVVFLEALRKVTRVSEWSFVDGASP